MTDTIVVTGYLRGGECAHCGRELKHVIVTDCGQFGAACMANKLTQPRVYQGRKYRLSTDAMISLAKQARDPERTGATLYARTFHAAA